VTGNNPQLNFTNPISESTSAKARWFALPNSTCGASLNSSYKIRLTVYHAFGESFSEHLLNVSIPEEAGRVAGPIITGTPDIHCFGVTPTCRVVGPGTLFRQTQSMIIHVLTSSQFYNKVYQHELVHENQWKPGGIAESYYLVADFYARIQNLTAPSQSSLQVKIETEKTQWLVG
jgi:hypothetical protein